MVWLQAALDNVRKLFVEVLDFCHIWVWFFCSWRVEVSVILLVVVSLFSTRRKETKGTWGALRLIVRMVSAAGVGWAAHATRRFFDLTSSLVLLVGQIHLVFVLFLEILKLLHSLVIYFIQFPLVIRFDVVLNLGDFIVKWLVEHRHSFFLCGGKLTIEIGLLLLRFLFFCGYEALWIFLLQIFVGVWSVATCPWLGILVSKLALVIVPLCWPSLLLFRHHCAFFKLLLVDLLVFLWINLSPCQILTRVGQKKFVLNVILLLEFLTKSARLLGGPCVSFWSQVLVLH